MSTKPTDEDTAITLDPETASILRSIFGNSCNTDVPAPEDSLTKTASVKFMITLQDEQDLRNQGYSLAQIQKMKPEEASEIIKAGTRALEE